MKEGDYLQSIEDSRAAFEELEARAGGDIDSIAGLYTSSTTATHWFWWCAAIRTMQGE
ncbi:hypothetical protein [Burkholderia cepacia]|uniref:hypothetical protein n=1 Tax=Burkholderia cepacia TaxID=292 RepID=UPI0012D8DE05|nr:hypothetical protein [Burkholderia cepacia]